MSLHPTFARNTMMSDPFCTDVWDDVTNPFSHKSRNVSHTHRTRKGEWTPNKPGINIDFIENQENNTYILEAGKDDVTCVKILIMLFIYTHTMIIHPT